MSSPAADAESLVSCVIIFLNEERFLDEAIGSVVAQEYPHWELLLVDDGSTDGSTAIARRWATERPDRIRYLEHPGHANLGMSASRNVGIAHARGAFIAFLDADDVWLAGKLEAQVAILRAHPDVGMVCGATVMWHGWSPTESGAAQDWVMEVGGLPERPRDPSPYREQVLRPPTAALALYPLGAGFSPSTSSYLLRRSTVERVGGYETRFRAMYEDQAFQIKMYLAAPVYVSATVWDRYRQRRGSTTSRARRERRVWTERGRFLAWLGDYLERAGVADPAVRRAYADAVWPFRHPHLFRVRQLAVWLLPAPWFARLTSLLRGAAGGDA